MKKKIGNPWRCVFLGVIFIAVCIIYIAVFINLQVSGQDYYEIAGHISNRTRTVKIQAQRGEIYDRNGKKLVSNEYYYDLQLDYGSMPSKAYEKNNVLLNTVSCLTERGEAEKIQSPKYYPFNITEGDEKLYFEYNESFFDSARVSRYNKMAADLEIDDKSADEAGIAIMQRYGIADSDGVLLYSTDKARLLFEYRLDTEMCDFSNENPYTVAKDISLETVSVIKESYPRGLNIYCGMKRSYNYPGYASHIIGRLGKISANDMKYYTDLGYPMDAEVGISGVEAAFESYLHGVDGTLLITEDSYGNIIDTKVETEPTAGLDVYLTIDIDLQMTAEDYLADNIEFVKSQAYAPQTGEDSKAGAVTSVDPKTGEVLAIASFPTYDLSTFSDDLQYLTTDETSPMLNRALNSIYEPGSTFKPGVAAAALDAGVITPYETINDVGRYTYYSANGPRCWINVMYGGTRGHGELNVTGAIQESCNYFFYEAGRRLTIDGIVSYMKGFGLGSPTGIELSENTGILNCPEYRDDNGLEAWNPGDTLYAAIGQLHLFNPLQMSMYISALINNGTRYNAHVLYKACEYGTDTPVHEAEQKIMGEIKLKDGISTIVLDAMKDVIESGSASYLFKDYQIAVGGKTGTAQISETKSDNAVFTAFAPFDDPEIVTTCVIEQGNTGANAGYTVRGIFDKYFSVGDFAPDAPEDGGGTDDVPSEE